MASMRLSFLSFFGNNQNTNAVGSPLNSQGQPSSLAAGRTTAPVVSPLSATASTATSSSTLSKEPSLVSWLLSNVPARQTQHQYDTTAHSQGSSDSPPSNTSLASRLPVLQTSPSARDDNVADADSTHKSMGKDMDKKKSKNHSLLQRQPRHQHQHPLADVSSDLYLLFSDDKSLDSFIHTIQSLKNDYTQATITSRAMLHQHLNAARLKEAETIERARRQRAKEETEAQHAFEAVVLSARRQLESLVLAAVKKILDAPPSLLSQNRSCLNQDGRSQQESTANTSPRDEYGREHSPMADKAIERVHKARANSKGQSSTKGTEGREAWQDQGQGDVATAADTTSSTTAAAATNELLFVQQQQQPLRQNRTSARFGWQFKKASIHHPPQSASQRQHGQDQEEARRESLRARLKQLVELEERKLREYSATARSSYPDGLPEGAGDRW